MRAACVYMLYFSIQKEKQIIIPYHLFTSNYTIKLAKCLTINVFHYSTICEIKKWNFLTTIQPDAKHVGDCEKGENEIKFNEGKVYVEI